MDESSSSAPTPEPLERKMTRSLLALSNDEMTIPRQLAAIAPRAPPAPSRAEDTPAWERRRASTTPSPPARRRSWHPKEEPRTPPRAPTPLPMGRIAVLVMVLLADTLSLTCVIPFTPFLVARYHEGPDYAVGYWSGLLAACYSIGQLISNPLWGAASDRYGRRPVMLVSLLLSCACLIAFGASTSLPAALVCRFANGLMSGNVVVAKVMMADITDRSNEAAAFQYVGLAFGIGSMVGPIIGGPLAEPADKYDDLPFESLWRTHPFLLPCLCVAAFMVVDWCLAFFLLQESKEDVTFSRADYGAVEAEEAPEDDEDTHAGGVEELLQDPCSPFRSVCASYALFGTCMTAFLEAFPIFLRAPVDEGGLGLDSTDVGLIQAVAGAAGICIVSIGVLPMMAKRFTIPGTYWRNLTFSACCYLVPPALAAWSGSTPWLGLGLAIGGVALVNQMSYGTINIMIKNVASPELLGAALCGNQPVSAAVGLGSSIGTAGMAVGPIWGGSLFAYSSDPDAELGPILGKGRLFFATLSLLAVLNSRLASRLPPWPRDGQDWRYEFFRCRRTSLQRLPAPCGAVA